MNMTIFYFVTGLIAVIALYNIMKSAKKSRKTKENLLNMRNQSFCSPELEMKYGVNSQNHNNRNKDGKALPIDKTGSNILNPATSIAIVETVSDYVSSDGEKSSDTGSHSTSSSSDSYSSSYSSSSSDSSSSSSSSDSSSGGSD